jgi:hypothetical protein
MEVGYSIEMESQDYGQWLNLYKRT